MHTIAVATIRLRDKVTETEEAVDEAVLKVTALINEIVMTRGAFRSHEAAGRAQPALLRVQKALADLNAAQGEIARAHGELRSAYKTVSGPEEPSCPDMPSVLTDAQITQAG